MMVQACNDFLKKEVIPLTEKIDSKKFPDIMPNLIEKAGELGLLGLSIDQEYGGMDIFYL